MLYCKDKHFLIKYGYDYNMYIICEELSDAVKESIEKLGLFIEDFNLP